MGWISKRKSTTGLHLAHGAKVGKRAGVLRKIVGIMLVSGMEYEELECGHKGVLLCSINTDMFSPSPANSRRCMQCRKEADEIKNPAQ